MQSCRKHQQLSDARALGSHRTALQVSLAVAESLFIVLAEGFVSLLPSKFPGI